jgi:hypothetical protein
MLGGQAASGLSGSACRWSGSQLLTWMAVREAASGVIEKGWIGE